MAKHYVLTGGATGIGAATKDQLRASGHTVTTVDIQNADIVADLGKPETRQQAIDTLKKHGPFDGIITCAGVASHFKDTAAIVSINYYGTVELIERLRAHLNPAAKIVAISSNSAPMCQTPALVEALLTGSESDARVLAQTVSGHECYSGSKQAVARWVRRSAPEWARSGIAVNAVAPGYIETPMTQAVAKSPEYADSIRQFLQSIPLQRAGQPQDIADLVSFLLSDNATFIAGSVLFCDGGHDALFRPDQL
jgi:NAD(P)-dependent dehydrogenase (short-subunit alcohol dehydrogenase family)